MKLYNLTESGNFFAFTAIFAGWTVFEESNSHIYHSGNVRHSQVMNVEKNDSNKSNRAHEIDMQHKFSELQCTEECRMRTVQSLENMCSNLTKSYYFNFFPFLAFHFLPHSRARALFLLRTYAFGEK